MNGTTIGAGLQFSPDLIWSDDKWALAHSKGNRKHLDPGKWLEENRARLPVPTTEEGHRVSFVHCAGIKTGTVERVDYCEATSTDAFTHEPFVNVRLEFLVRVEDALYVVPYRLLAETLPCHVSDALD
jgi:hypothetical protein